jgi:pimeloyl-ACP methyl ester carboxylesterase
MAGICAHPVGYVQSFQGAAAARGDLVALQGDISCGGNGALRKWSSDIEAMDRRIEAAFRAGGLGEPRGVTVIGYSQGAERAERLVARWPARYARAILMSGPVVPSPKRLAGADAVALTVGSREFQGYVRGAVGPLVRSGIPARLFVFDGAQHGELGAAPTPVMNQVFDFLEENEKVKRPRPPDVTTKVRRPMDPS